MKKTNIIHIFGNNSFLVEREKVGMITLFREKYGEMSIHFCQLQNNYNEESLKKYREYSAGILSGNLFAEKQLFVFFGGNDKKSTDEWKKISKKTNDKEEEYGITRVLESILPNIPETAFLLFHNIGKSEKNLLKWLDANASEREKNLSFSPRDWEKYTYLSTKILTKILKIYEETEKNRDRNSTNPELGHNIFQSIKHLEILEKNNFPLDDAIIEKFTHSYDGYTVFRLIDAIFWGNISEAHRVNTKIMNNISEKNLDIFFGWFITNFRKSVYILKLHELGFSSKEIEKYLWVKNFQINKTLWTRIEHEKLKKFFQKIILSNIAYKRGKWMKETLLWRFFEIDKALLELKK